MKMTNQPDLFAAIAEGVKLKNDGLNQAVQHAETIDPGWKDKAWRIFTDWIRTKPAGYFFMLEDFRRLCERDRLIENPPSKRAYGFLTVNAAKAGMIRPNGTAKVNNPKAHRANASVWIVK